MDEGGVTPSGKYAGVVGARYEAIEVPAHLRNPDRPPYWTVMRFANGEQEACGATRPYATEAEAQAVADDLNKERLG